MTIEGDTGDRSLRALDEGLAAGNGSHLEYERGWWLVYELLESGCEQNLSRPSRRSARPSLRPPRV
ncbi:MAG: hypothetical protein M3N46_05740 [Actinomycetota bacterium]|nr:hypothetical protein [Actinomycetota bacterium]